MLKKRALSASRDMLIDSSYDVYYYTNTKYLETGYADTQLKWPYWVRPYYYSTTEFQEMTNWLIETMGNCNWFTENARWVGSDQKYWFRDERDRIMFILKWS